MDLSFFLNHNILDAGARFFEEVLDIKIDPASKTEINLKEFLKEYLTDEVLLNKIADARLIGMVNDLSIGGKEQKVKADEILHKDNGDYDMLIVFGIELAKEVHPTRSDISRLTRALNRRSASRPVVLLTRYSDKLTFSAAERGQYKREGQKGEKVGRISMLKGIYLRKIHAGHERILRQLSIQEGITSFNSIYSEWRKVFDLKILNKEFYLKVAAWYSTAISAVEFPSEYYKTLPENKNKNTEELQDIANQIACIRLLTRLIFVWFLRHKHRGKQPLIPDILFDNEYMDTVLNYSDKKGSTYYKAILQNLFFATFNTTIDSDLRRPSSKSNKDHKMPAYRYQDYFINPEKSYSDLFADIPFLNGGLFENLDPEHSSIRIDWFSDPDLSHPYTKENALKVPDWLFFGNKDNEGLYSIFNEFYFTIEENTPLDQEIALDPELLGKIFENLLASYLPESRTTARKKTGSYYTPREIVNYMVDESLLTYLAIRLRDDGTNNEDKTEKKLRNLLEYDSEENPFSDNIPFTNRLIRYLSEVKILDPACGSGAFPMGMLHQIVHALGKLDPGNRQWEHEQLEILLRPKIEDLVTVSHISSEKARQEAEKLLKEEINEIKETFLKNDPDYTRKLYLIQNCIFGVDIQPVAIHISKLRFFISLMVNQKIDEKARKENYGIKPLPNLETKFVAANTLKQLIAPQTRSEDVIRIENNLKTLRNSFFFTRNRSEKLRLEKDDEKLRLELEILLNILYSSDNRQFDSKIEDLEKKKDLLEKELKKATLKESQKSAIKKELKQIYFRINQFEDRIIDDNTANTLSHQIARWNPYNQNTYADWFDPEWMFGLPSNTGFDIVIGNPPYGGTKLEESITDWLGLESKDPYGAFIARFLGSGARKTPLKNAGILAFIVSDTFMTIKSHLPLRRQMLDNYMHKMIRVHQDTFGATVNTAIIICRRNEFPKDENGQTIRTIEKNHKCQMVDLTNVSIHEQYQRFTDILQMTVTNLKAEQISNSEYAIYTYYQRIIHSNSNLPFFVASPDLFKLMNDGNDPENRPEIIRKQIGAKSMPLGCISINGKKLELLKLGDIADVKVGLQTGDNSSYLYQRPEARGSYRNIQDFIDYLLTEDDLNRIRGDEELRLAVIKKGISKENPKSRRYFGGRYIVPYDKGGESDSDDGWLPNYYVITPYYIDWSEHSVSQLLNGSKISIRSSPSYPRNIMDYFKEGISFSRIGLYSPTFRFDNRGPFDVNGCLIFSDFEVKNLISFLTSKLFRYFLKNFFGHTVSSQVDELKEIRVPVDDFLNVPLINSIIQNQRKSQKYDYSSNEQIEIENNVYKKYYLDINEINEVEVWYSRRYPRLSAAQKANLRKLGKSDDYLELYGLRNQA